MRKYLRVTAALGVLAISAADIVPDRVAYFAFGLLLAHWASGELAKLRESLRTRPVDIPPFSPDWDSCPLRPIFGQYGFEDETLEQFEERTAHYEAMRDTWVVSEARRMVTSSR